MSTDQSLPILTPEEEDALVHKRLTGPDERPLRRLTKKFHLYASAVSPLPTDTTPPSQINDARDAFLVELSNFHLFLKKQALVCESERRQVKEYELEKERIAKEHFVLRDEIAKLKVTLEEAQISRRQKIEYDVIAEKVNVLPPRADLEKSIASLEEEIISIEQRKEADFKFMQTRQEQFKKIIADMNLLRSMGNPDTVTESDTPAPDGDAMEGVEIEGPVDDEDEDAGMKDDSSDDSRPLSSLNPHARPFHPRTSGLLKSHLRGVRATPSSSAPASPSPAPPQKEEGEEEDIEMGEVAESGEDAAAAREREREEREREMDRNKRKPGKVKEELEEGEASDASSALTELPDE